MSATLIPTELSETDICGLPSGPWAAADEAPSERKAMATAVTSSDGVRRMVWAPVFVGLDDVMCLADTQESRRVPHGHD